MSEAIIITPVKDSKTTTKRTIEAICQAEGDFDYYVYNDFSQPDTKQFLDKASTELGFQVIHLEEITNTPSPNYKLVLELAQKMALEQNKPLIIVESDVVVQKSTLKNLVRLSKEKEKGIVKIYGTRKAH